jgi:hypothetical protein
MNEVQIIGGKLLEREFFHPWTSLIVEKIPEKKLKVKSVGLSFPRIPCSFEHDTFSESYKNTLFIQNE